MSEYLSSCCGAAPVGASEDMGMCPDCREHCEYTNSGDWEDVTTPGHILIDEHYSWKPYRKGVEYVVMRMGSEWSATVRTGEEYKTICYLSKHYLPSKEIAEKLCYAHWNSTSPADYDREAERILNA